MKRALAIFIATAAVFVCGLAAASPPIIEPCQFNQFCEHQQVEGIGYVEIQDNIVDKTIALDYTNQMMGDGEFEMDSTHTYSQEPNKLVRPTPNCTSPNGTLPKRLNFYEDTKMSFNVRKMPMMGMKTLESRGFYGGMNADVKETFWDVNSMEKKQTTYFGSTNNSDITHTIGIDTANQFNGTWGIDSSKHTIFYQDIKTHRLYSGEFGVQDLTKFHENPVYERRPCPCAGIDC
ncbi:MAG: hypothetical protein ACXQT4_06845 [Methanotrichaceae archaeon]